MQTQQPAKDANVDALALKQARLDALLRGLGGVVVAFSGGVDSAYLLAAAYPGARRAMRGGHRGVPLACAG